MLADSLTKSFSHMKFLNFIQEMCIELKQLELLNYGEVLNVIHQTTFFMLQLLLIRMYIFISLDIYN